MSLEPFQLPPPTQPMLTASGTMDRDWYHFFRQLYRWQRAAKAVPRAPHVTAAEQAAIDADEGMSVYDSGALKVEFYENGSWVSYPTNQAATYTVTNGATDRAYDANTTSIDELADVLGTLIADLQSAGLIQ